MNKLALFNIDGTLLKNSNVHIEAFSIAFKKIYGINTIIDIIDHEGRMESIT